MSFRSASEVSLTVLVLIGVLGCASEREREFAGGVHPPGWGDQINADEFHGEFLRTEFLRAGQGYPLDECQSCHGLDFAGGDSGVSCSDRGVCHAQGVDSCAGACHGDDTGPRPASGAHTAHALYCDTCHPQPTTLAPPHVDRRVDVELAGLAARGGHNPAWNSDSETCSNTYCHLGDSPPWSSDTMLSCNGCHSQSPTHDSFDRVVDESTCSGCHGGSPELGHLDGELVVSITGCNGCHGVSATTGAPGPALDGSTDPASPRVGAHRRHLDSLLSGRIGKVVACRRCHQVPEEPLSPGHLDSMLPAEVDVVLGSYKNSTGSCVVDCHFDRDPGPVWSDDSGGERACDACHAFPPVLTRIGTRHPPSPPDLGVCVECHVFTPTTHVDGQVTFQ